MLVEGDPHQTRIAVLEEGRVVEVVIEPRSRRDVVGSIFKGRVTRVLPGMQAAFVDIGLERHAFLHVSDVEGGGVLDDLGEDDEPAASAGERGPSIAELLEPGQEVVVQVLKDELPGKGARVSTQLALPGRFLVFLPTVRHLGVSRRIGDEDERARLRALFEEPDIDRGGAGLIVRTASQGRSAQDLEAELAHLRRLWDEIQCTEHQRKAPALLHRDLALPLRAFRDLLPPDCCEVWVEGQATYRDVTEFLERFLPALADLTRQYRDAGTLFERFGVEREIEAALKSRVWLKSGGYIVINPTEALVAIDVNTGRYVGRDSLEETVVRINLEAVREIVRQIRLRDLGGIIVIDLIDMTDPEHRRQVFTALERELEKDRARTRLSGISEFGLVQVTRKRSRANLQSLLTRKCPCCQGLGRVRSLGSICLSLRREVLSQRERLGPLEVRLRVHPEVCAALHGEERPVLEELESALGRRLVLEEAPELPQERFVIL